MNIFYTSDNNFVPQLGAGICSVCENNQPFDEIHFYIGSLGITEENQSKLCQLTERYHRDISFVEIGDIRSLIGFDFDTTGWNPIVLARLFVERLLPESVSRILYLDSDTVVCGDLTELWNINLKGNVLAASIEATMNQKRRDALGLESNPYYNSGVLLIDLQRWREIDAGNRILQFYASHDGRLFAPDQDAINGALAGQILTVSPKYNYYTMCWYYPYRLLKKICSPAPYISKELFLDAQNNPIIIHYLGEVRPWRKGNGHKYEAEFFRYLKKTPWANMPLETGWETYFKCYRLFLLVTTPFPAFRYHFLSGFFPLLVKYRKHQRLKESHS